MINEPTTAQSPTKTLAMGAVSPISRKGTVKNASPKNAGSNGMTKNNFSQAAPPKPKKASLEEKKGPHKEVRLDSPTSGGFPLQFARHP